MSWEAVTWANKQRLKKCYEQAVLLVLANCADPNGEAFVKWPGRDHWWKYLSDRTRLPKSSLFKHLNTIVALGLGERSDIVMSDGSRRPTFTLNMNAFFDIENFEDEQLYNAVTSKGSAESQSIGETGNDDDAEHGENDSDYSAPPTAEKSQSTGETGNSIGQSTGETQPVPVQRLHKDSKSVPKDSPQPPSGGPSAPDSGWEEFSRVWREPMPRHDLARSAWDHLPTDKRGEATAAARGYWAWRVGQRKPPTPISAQTFLRDAAGWAQWLRYVPSADGAPSVVVDQYAASSREGRAIAVLYELAGKSDFFRQVKCRDGKVYFANPITPRLLTLADSPPRTEWVTLDRQQAAAWEGLLSGYLQMVRTRLAEGSSAPWPWPPRKDGHLSPTEPPTSPGDVHETLNNR